MAADDAKIDDRRRTAAACFFLIYIVPVVVVTVHWSGPIGAAPRTAAPAVLGVGIGGFALLFLVLAFAAPWMSRKLARVDLARTWQRAALHAGPPAALVTTLGTLQRLRLGPLGVQLATMALVSAISVGAMALLESRWSRTHHDARG